MNSGRELVLAPGGEIPASAIERAAAVVASGGVILYPTDTIYGLGCDALNPASVRTVYDVKRRPEEKPMIVLVPSISSAEALVGTLSPEALALARAFWPGPLTILFRADSSRAPWLSGATGKLGLRLPDNAFCRRVMEASSKPLLSTSANLSGEPYVSDMGRLRELFLQEVALFVDAGALAASPPSTIVDASGARPAIVREGALPRSALEAFLRADKA